MKVKKVEYLNVIDDIPALLVTFDKTFLHHTNEARDLLYDDYTDEDFIAQKLSTRIRQADLTNEYQIAYKNPWKIVKTFDELFNAVRDEVRKSSGYHTPKRTPTSSTQNIEEILEEMKDWWFDQLTRVMKSAGFCCGRWYRFEMREIQCCGKRGCRIRTDHMKYYRYKDWTYCENCFKKQKDLIELDSAVAKSEFKEYVWISVVDEEFVDCKYCGRNFHQVCVFHLKENAKKFVCENCGGRQKMIRASQLPPSPCDEFIQQFLKDNNVNLEDRVTIRLLSRERKTMMIPESVKELKHYRNAYEYIDNSLYMFLRSDNGRDVSFFAVYFQLFDDDCEDCMKNSVYISFIDSVKLLPDNYRKSFNHLVLLGLFSYLNSQGYTRIFIWSVPSEPPNDYIFHKKPPLKKHGLNITKSNFASPQKKLNEWYRQLFKLGEKHKIIKNYSSFRTYSKEKVKTLDNIPFYQGDLWSSKMDESISQTKKEFKRLKDGPKKLKISKEKMRKLKEQLEGFDLVKVVWDKMQEQIEELGSDYFCLTLIENEEPTVYTNEQIKSCDFIKSSMFGDRLDVTDFLWSHNLEFSSKRRAEYSTYYLLNYFLKTCVQNCEVNIEKEILDEDCKSSLFFSNQQCIVLWVKDDESWESFDEMNTTLILSAFQSDSKSRKSIDEFSEAELILNEDSGYNSRFGAEDISFPSDSSSTNLVIEIDSD